MMVIVDTSVWISYFKGHDPTVIKILKSLLDDDAVYMPVLVKLELLAGCKSADMSRLRRLFSALPQLAVSSVHTTQVELWMTIATKNGERFGLVDFLIAAIAREFNSRIWSLDKDFERMKKLSFCELYK